VKTTRECTEIIFSHPGEIERLVFSHKQFKVFQCLSCKPYKSKKCMNTATIGVLLDAKEEELRKLKRKPARMVEEKPYKPSWQEVVNKRRRLVASFLYLQPSANLAEVSRFTGCSYGLVKRVAMDMHFLGAPEVFQYQNTKKPEDVEALANSISQVRGAYTTISDIKRNHQSFSRRWISKKLRSTGHRWLLMAKRRRIPKKEANQGKKVVAVLRHLAQALNNDKVNQLYIDEVHFPLYQCSTHHWKHREDPEDATVYNRRPVPDDHKLSVIALSR